MERTTIEIPAWRPELSSNQEPATPAAWIATSDAQIRAACRQDDIRATQELPAVRA